MEKWLDSKTITIWIIVVLLLITLLAFSVIKLVYIYIKKTLEHKLKESSLRLEYQNKLIKTSIVAQEQERNRIASDLHDSIIGKLTVLQLKSQLKHQPEEINILLQESINDTRRISHDLSPPMVNFKCISELIHDVIFPWNLHFTTTYYKNIQSEPFIAENLKIQIIRILQELIINIHKHSCSKSITVILKITSNFLSLVVSDKGIGFTQKNEIASNGIGLNNIALRVHYLEGQYKIKSNKKGTRTVFVFNIS